MDLQVNFRLNDTKLLQNIFCFLLFTFLTGCFAVLKEKSITSTQSSTSGSDSDFTQISNIYRLSPTSVRETRPRLSVSGVTSGDLVELYSDANCTQKIGETVATGTSATVQVTNDLNDGTYTIYALRGNGNGLSSDCSTVSVNLTVDTVMNAPTISSLSKTTGISIISQLSNLVIGDTITFYEQQTDCQNSNSAVKTETVASSSQDIHFHSLTAATYQYWLKVSYQRSYSTVLESSCIQTTAVTLNGQNLSTTYITQWQTDAVNAGEKTVRFPGTNSQDIIINWGDGSSSRVTDASQANSIHTYTNAGTYNIEISGTINGLRLYYDMQKLKDVLQWGTYKWKNLDYMFRQITFSGFSASDSPDLTECTSLAGTFALSQFNGSINHWNISHVTDLSYIFSGASAFNQPLNNWNTTNVTKMSGTFYDAGSFNQPLSNWITSNVSDMSNMFLNAGAFNQDVSSWNTANVTNMSLMFSSASAFNQPIGTWNTSKVTNMVSMFEFTTSFNQSINNWDVSKVTDMSFMFRSSGYDQPLNSWDVGSVTNMQNMFTQSSFNQNINSWNTSNVVNMNSMFSSAVLFNQPLNNWNVAKVTNMYSMFRLAQSFNQDISSWNTSSVVDMYMMFSYASVFNQDLRNWTVNPNVLRCSDFFDSSALTNIPNFTQCNPN